MKIVSSEKSDGFSTYKYYADEPSKGWGVFLSHGRSAKMVHSIGVWTGSVCYNSNNIVDFVIYEDDPVYYKLADINKEGLHAHNGGVSKEITRQYVDVLMRYALEKMSSEDFVNKFSKFMDSCYKSGFSDGKREIQKGIVSILGI